jgi:hypothetical protein
VAYDIYPSEIIKKLKKQDNVLNNILKEIDNAIKEKDEIFKRLIIHFYFQEQKTKESIADLMGLPIEFIDDIIFKAKTN